jgi:hypothetical protein
MTEFSELLGQLTVQGPLPVTDDSGPLGAAWLPRPGRGLGLTASGYREEEYLISGQADDWTWDEHLRPVTVEAVPFISRILLRRPADPADFSGAVFCEPNHADYDRSLTWSATAPWLVRSGHAHVGVTQEPAVLPDLARWDPARYGELSIPRPGQRWDIVGLVAAVLAGNGTGLLAGARVKRVIMSGWSQTGTFCRTFLGEGFHARSRAGNRPAVSGYVICISSGGAARPGYGVLRPSAVLPPGDPRRTVGAYGVPVVELLSESESETHQAVLRPDCDDRADPYRLYQVAGTGHVTGHHELATNRLQLAARGWATPPPEVNERLSDGRMDLVARAVFAAVDRWVADGTVPPRMPGRFQYADPASPLPRGRLPGSVPLVRDDDGNVAGGIRTPWVEVPLGGHFPHSTPVPGRCQPAPHAPYSDPALLADLWAHLASFPRTELIRRYGDRDEYLSRVAAAAQAAVRDGWLLADDVPEYLAGAKEEAGAW